jgi:hypothetical protein
VNRVAWSALGLVLALVVATACAGAGRPAVTVETLKPRQCSAEGLHAGRLRSPDPVPRAVRRARRAIVDAATRCDYQALEALAERGGLSVTIDGADVPVASWPARERDDRPILSFLVGILGLTAATTDDGVAWPAAVTWPGPDDGRRVQRRALERVVGDDGVFGWEETGGYAGWRTTIDVDGRWTTLSHGPLPDAINSGSPPPTGGG